VKAVLGIDSGIVKFFVGRNGESFFRGGDIISKHSGTESVKL
jgi:hypothetical protein